MRVCSQTEVKRIKISTIFVLFIFREPFRTKILTGKTVAQTVPYKNKRRFFRNSSIIRKTVRCGKRFKKFSFQRKPKNGKLQFGTIRYGSVR